MLILDTNSSVSLISVWQQEDLRKIRSIQTNLSSETMSVGAILLLLTQRRKSVIGEEKGSLNSLIFLTSPLRPSSMKLRKTSIESIKESTMPSFRSYKMYFHVMMNYQLSIKQKYMFSD
jgi:hypothetical protein